ncbi:MAG: LytTR family DNA-binding domain-containing protein [Eubacterium sp.]|nr:LytTR family DNA-binding domain-containing protein [Eubacterium sp.]
MNRTEILEKTMSIIQAYCDHDMQPIIDNCADDVLCLGPRDNLVTRTRAAVAASWKDTQNSMRFRTEDISAYTIPLGAHSMNVVLEYKVRIELPEGPRIHSQRGIFSWIDKKITDESGKTMLVPRLSLISLSNIPPRDKRDSVFNVWGDLRFTEKAEHQVSADVASRVTIPSRDHAFYYYNSTRILWIESADEGHHSIVHTDKEEIACTRKLSYFTEQYPNIFLAPHISCLINPLYISILKRFSLTLADGTVLPVPEKKYTAFRRAIDEWELFWNTHR